MERIYGAEEHVELSTKVRLARRGPPRSLLSYCIVSTPRCAVLEQVFSPLVRPPPFYTGSLLALSSLFLSFCQLRSIPFFQGCSTLYSLQRSLPTLASLPNCVRLSYGSKAGLVTAYERAIKLSSFPPFPNILCIFKRLEFWYGFVGQMQISITKLSCPFPFLLRLDQHVLLYQILSGNISLFRRFRDILYNQFKCSKETDDQIGG